METYKFDIRTTNRNDIAAEIVDGTLANTSLEEQLSMRDGDIAAVVADIVSYYDGENVAFVDQDGDKLDVAAYATSYIEARV
jgi:hypothetical protein